VGGPDRTIGADRTALPNPPSQGEREFLFYLFCAYHARRQRRRSRYRARMSATVVPHRHRPQLRHLATGLGAIIVGSVLLLAIFAPVLAPHDPFAQNLTARLTPPQWMDGGSAVHPFGTDQLGRDYLSRLIFGARISMLIGTLTVVTSGLIGITLGVLGGYFGGRVDDAVMFVITCRLAIPLILVALTVVALIGSSLTVVVATLGLLLWDRFAVVARTTTMQVRNLDYIAAAQAAGASRAHILLREVLPNILTHLVVVATLEMALATLLEAALSFLGLGVPPPLPSWGLMIAEAKDYMFFSPWVIMIPGVALFVLVLGINLLGDGLGDLLGTGRPR
jgi:peptide/nickel transport system permease protein